MPRPMAVRVIEQFSPGSGTRFWEARGMKEPVYWTGKLVWWLTGKHPRTAGAVVSWAVACWWLRSYAEGTLLWGALLGAVLTAWITWTRRSGASAGANLGPRYLWWRHRALKHLERQWPKAARRMRLLADDEAHDSVPLPLQKVRARSHGTLVADVDPGTYGILLDDLKTARAGIKQICHCYDVTVTESTPGKASLVFHYVEPLRRVLPLDELPLAPEGRLAYGVRADGSAMTLVPYQSFLAGGLTRRGKSNLIRTLLFDCIRQNIPVDLYISDAKGGVEFTEFERYMTPIRRAGDPVVRISGRERLIQVKGYARDPNDVARLVEQAEQDMQDRRERMRAAGIVEITQFTDEYPLAIVLIDELIPLEQMIKEGSKSALARIGYMGAAAGFAFWACAQVAQMDVLGPLRRFIPQRSCMATKTVNDTNAFLGDNAEQAGAKCSQIRVPGVGYAWNDDDQQPTMFRVPLVTPKQAKAIAGGEIPDDVALPVPEATKEKRGRGGRTALYRWWPKDEPRESARLLYVGVTNKLDRRIAEHIGDERLFALENVVVEAEFFATRAEALEAERVACETENPVYNVQLVKRGRGGRRQLEGAGK